QVLQAHGRAVAVGHDERPELGRALELAVRLHRVGAVRAPQDARWQVDVAGGDAVRDLVDPDGARRQRLGSRWMRTAYLAAADAMVSGLAPGRLAFTWIVGKSTFGRLLTGKRRYAITPNMRMPSMTSVVMTGRLMNSSEMFIYPPPSRARGRPSPSPRRARRLPAGPGRRSRPRHPAARPGRSPHRPRPGARP